MTTNNIAGYLYSGSDLNNSHGYLLPIVLQLLGEQNLSVAEKRVFELGCGNGSVAQAMSDHGWEVTGVDPSKEGIEQARQSRPHLNLHEGSAYDDLATQFGRFPVLVSLEVVEHVYAPRDYAHTVYQLLEPGGVAIISTPYHGYFKNLALAATGKLDAHFTALWDYGHIKFWSMNTLRTLLEETGLEVDRFERVGRIPALAKSMIAVVSKPRC